MSQRGEVLRRRTVSVPGLFVAAVVLAVGAPLWLPVAIVVDAIRRRWRWPIARLLAFGLCWSWLETAGVLAAAWLWVRGRSSDRPAHVRLQRWWATNLMRALGVTTGVRVESADVAAMLPGPVIVLCRHASLADSLLSAYVITAHARLEPRYVLKRELLADPCLDIVGNRLTNHFLDREAVDSDAELDALRRLTSSMGPQDAAVIFPEGTRASPAKRARALARIESRDPSRAARLRALRHLLPPRPAGTLAMLDGHPTADVVVAWHVGFDGLDTFGGILAHLGHPPAPVRFGARRIPRAAVPHGAARQAWLDEQWLRVDETVAGLLGSPSTATS